MVDELFTLDEARTLLAALRDTAPDGLRAPLSRRDALAVISAGAEVKDLERGLVDFPAEIDGVLAYWCWLASEPEIEWWHPRDAGFAGRRRIDDAGPG